VGRAAPHGQYAGGHSKSAQLVKPEDYLLLPFNKNSGAALYGK